MRLREERAFAPCDCHQLGTGHPLHHRVVLEGILVGGGEAHIQGVPGLGLGQPLFGFTDRGEILVELLPVPGAQAPRELLPSALP